MVSSVCHVQVINFIILITIPVSRHWKWLMYKLWERRKIILNHIMLPWHQSKNKSKMRKNPRITVQAKLHSTMDLPALNVLRNNFMILIRRIVWKLNTSPMSQLWIKAKMCISPTILLLPIWLNRSKKIHLCPLKHALIMNLSTMEKLASIVHWLNSMIWIRKVVSNLKSYRMFPLWPQPRKFISRIMLLWKVLRLRSKISVNPLLLVLKRNHCSMEPSVQHVLKLNIMILLRRTVWNLKVSAMLKLWIRLVTVSYTHLTLPTTPYV